MNKLVTIIRKPTGLFGLICRAKYKFNITLQHSKGNTLKELDSYYECLEIPLKSLDKKLCSKKDKILSAWNDLSKVEGFDQKTLEQVLFIIKESQLDPFTELINIPILVLEQPEKVIKPTAAHPRAYKGTKYQPPKLKQPKEINLQPYLCDEKNISIILEQFNVAPEKEIRFPKAFTKYLLPFLKQTNKILSFLEVFWNLRLDKKQNLLMHITRVLCLNPKLENVFKWCQIIAKQRPRRRAIFVTLLIKSGVHLLNANEQIAQYLDRFNLLTSKKYYVSRLFFFLSAIRKNINLDYIFVGFTLANKYLENYHFENLTHALPPSTESIEKIVKLFKNSEHGHERLAIHIWERCGVLIGFVDVLSSINLHLLPTELAYQYLKLYLYNDLEESIIKWAFIKEQANKLDSLLHNISREYQGKFIKVIDYFYWRWDEVSELKHGFNTICLLLERLCSAPFRKETSFAETLIYFVKFSDKPLQKILFELPNSSFLNLEKACYLQNDNRLIADGIYVLMEELSEFTVNSLLISSAMLLKIAKQLGTLNKPNRYLLANQFKQHKIMTTDFLNTPLPSAFLILENIIAGKNIFNPVSDKLKQFVKKGIDVKEQLLEHYKEQMFKDLYRTKLEILEQLIKDKLQKDYVPVIAKQDKNLDKNLDYALQFMNYIDSNQRPLKKFLKAYLRGDRDYLHKHPESQAWLKKHSYLDLNLWNQGIEFTRVSKTQGEVFIEVEKDPLEVLKMGTYVGSCLSLGGSFTYSAAAVMLDINKQVLYARNKKKQVIARQLITISDEKKLVCFGVYPIKVDKELKAMFRDYDKLFAKKLAIPLYNNDEDNNDNENDNYEISNIISKDWWDDYAWDLSIDD